MMKAIGCGICIAFFGLISISGHANVLEDISFASLPGGRFEVQMKFDTPPALPADYVIDKPARIVFDFGDVTNGLSSKKFPLPFENAQSAVVLGGKDKTRLILNMTSLEIYKTRIEGNKLLVEVGGNKVQEALTKGDSYAEKVSSDLTQFDAAIKGIDFRRGENGEGKVLIDLSDSSVSVNVDQNTKEIKLSFLDTKLPVDLRRKLDVVDFATPVTSISSSFDGQDSVILIKPEGEYDYLAYQADNLYVVSVKRLTQAEKEEKLKKFSFVGDKLSLNFQDIPVRSVLQIIADFTELNLVASDTVQGAITLRLDNVPWDQALDLVLKTKGLDKRQIGNVLMVAPADEIAEQERKQLESQRQIQELAPLQTEFIQILYADAEEIFTLFKGESGGEDGASTQSILSERGSAIVDKRTNSIVITETEQKIAAFRALIKQLDIPVRQVSIEARIVRATDSFSKSLGVQWGIDGNFIGSAINDSGSVRGFLAGGLAQNAVQRGGDPIKYEGGSAGVSSTTANSVNLKANSATSQLSLGLGTESLFLGLELSAMEGVGNGQVVSSPKIITQDKREASIKSGTKIPYTTVSDKGTETKFQDAVLGLTVTPYITPNDRVLMDIAVTKDSVGTVIGDDAIPIDTTNITTQIMVDNGQTAVIGGIFEEETISAVDKVPFFGDLPFVGRLFKRNYNSSQKIELLIFLTPRILSDPLARE